MPHVRTDAEALEVAAVVDGEDEPCERKEEGEDAKGIRAPYAPILLFRDCDLIISIIWRAIWRRGPNRRTGSWLATIRSMT